MNIIKTDTIIDPNHQQGFTGYSVAFLQNASKVILDGLAQAIIGESYDSTKAYIIKGLTAYGTNQYHEGYVLFQNEIYYSAGKSTTTAFSHVPVLNITSVLTAPADPCPFSDGTTENRHFTRTLTLVDAVSGDIILSVAIYVGALETYTPTLGIDGGTGSFSATSVSANYKITRDMVFISIIAAGITITGAPQSLTFSLPSDVPTIGNKSVFGVCNYYDGTTDFSKQMIFPSSSLSEKIGIFPQISGIGTFATTTTGVLTFNIGLMR